MKDPVARNVFAQGLILMVLMMCTAQLHATKPFEWQDFSTLPRAVAGNMVVWHRGKLLSLGGTYWQNNQKYWTDECWRHSPAPTVADWKHDIFLPTPMAYGVIITHGGQVYIFGGTTIEGASRRVYRYQDRTAAWDNLPDLPEPRTFAGGGLIGDRVYLACGTSNVSDYRTAMNSLISRNLTMAEDSWRVHRPLPGVGRAVVAAAVSGGQLYLFGGLTMAHGKTENLADAWAYDSAKDLWRALRPLPQPLRGMAACAINHHQIMLIGGFTTTPSGDRFSSDVWIYDTQKDLYESSDSLPYKVMPQALVADGYVYVLGGENQPRERINRVIRCPLE